MKYNVEDLPLASLNALALKALGFASEVNVPDALLGTYDGYAYPWNPLEDNSQIIEIIIDNEVQVSPPSAPVHYNGGPNHGWRSQVRWSACTWSRPRARPQSGGTLNEAVLRHLIARALGHEVELEE